MKFITLFILCVIISIVFSRLSIYKRNLQQNNSASNEIRNPAKLAIQLHAILINVEERIGNNPSLMEIKKLLTTFQAEKEKLIFLDKKSQGVFNTSKKNSTKIKSNQDLDESDFIPNPCRIVMSKNLKDKLDQMAKALLQNLNVLYEKMSQANAPDSLHVMIDSLEQELYNLANQHISLISFFVQTLAQNMKIDNNVDEIE